jgi:nitrogen fixation/metabolism regulation signal transduction histidine kinase
MADAILIEQVLVNLMKNSAESIDVRPPAGPAQCRTARASRRSGKPAWCGVHRDRHGKGLPPEVLERLFEAFFSTKRKAWAWA